MGRAKMADWIRQLTDLARIFTTAHSLNDRAGQGLYGQKEKRQQRSETACFDRKLSVHVRVTEGKKSE
jgi:hypothetical protein